MARGWVYFSANIHFWKRTFALSMLLCGCYAVAMVFQVVSYWLKPKEPTSKSQIPLSRLWFFWPYYFPPSSRLDNKTTSVLKSCTVCRIIHACSTNNAGRCRRQSWINYKFCSVSFFYVWAIVIAMTALASTAKQLTMKYYVFGNELRRNWNFNHLNLVQMNTCQHHNITLVNSEWIKT